MIKQNIITKKLIEIKQFFVQATTNGCLKTPQSYKSNNIVW